MNLREEKARKSIMGIMLFLCVIIPRPAFAGLPFDTVKGHVDNVLDVLRDPALKEESSKKVKSGKIREIAQKMFDFTELSKRTLAKNWPKFTPAQQKEFVDLYKSLLEDAYANKIMAYTGEEILFTKEIVLTEDKAEVQTTVVRKTGEIPIYYRVHKDGGVWKVYDVIVEGVSLASNYHSQFREILSNKPPESLIETLRKKVSKG